MVIRTLLYNSKEGSARISTGGAITSQSIDKDEYNECLIKIQKLLRTLDTSMDLTPFSRI